MKTRKLRNLEVSSVGMGIMGFSHGYGKVPDKNYAIEAIRQGFEAGCTFFDTAETYGREQFYPGHNEELLGKAIKPFRSQVILATKLHLTSSDFENGATLKEIIYRHLHQSLKRLQTNYVDLYYLHRLNENVPIEDVARVMQMLIDDGLIRGWGLSQVDITTLIKAHEITPVTAIQSLYSIVERDLEDEIFPYCLENNIGVVPFSPIASGFLSGKVTTETKFEGDDVRKWVPQLSKENIIANQPILEVINRFAKEKQATNAQISLAWMIHKYPNCVPIPGSKNKERILENLKAMDVVLTDEEFKQLQAALDQCQIHGHRGVVESEKKTFSNNWRK